MKKINFLIILSLLVLIIIFYFMSVSSPEQEGQEVTKLESLDHVVRLDIPKGALPQEVTRDEITITSVVTEGEEPGEEGFITYELAPEGLEFNTPVTIIFTAEINPDEQGKYIAPILIQEYKKGEEIIMEAVKDIKVVFNPQENKVIVSGLISHFSYIRFRVDGLFRAERTSLAGEYGIEQPFYYGLYVEPTGRSYSHTSLGSTQSYNVVSLKPGSSWIASGYLLSSEPPYVSPERKTLPSQKLGDTEKYYVSEIFVCEEEGEGYILPVIQINYTAHLQRIGSSGVHKDKVIFEIDEEVSTGFSYHPQYFNEAKLRQQYKCSKNIEMVQVCQPYMVVCDPEGGSKKGFVSGFYKCDPKTGELILNEKGLPVDSETGRPPEEMCPL
jgi:hypothetical protein